MYSGTNYTVRKNRMISSQETKKLAIGQEKIFRHQKGKFRYQHMNIFVFLSLSAKVFVIIFHMLDREFWQFTVLYSTNDSDTSQPNLG
jgi:hypothetical protein